MTTVQLPGASTNNSQMVMHAEMSNADVSLAMLFQKHLSDLTHAHGLIYHVKDRRRANTLKWIELEYRV